MRNDERQSTHVDRDGVTVTSTGNVRTGVWLLLVALGLVAIMLVFVTAPFVGEQSSLARPRRVARQATARDGAAIPARRSRASSTEERPHLPAGDDRHTVAGGEDATAPTDVADAQAAGSQAEEPSGIALFPPPGTKPIEAGIVVPDDFELPPGFVRHYQTTDSGKQLPAILKFHPDYQPVDANGEKIALPEDRIVPAEMAPPGLPHRMLDVADDPVPLVEGPHDRPDAD